MKNKKIFLLGVGAQKGGTTWLHSQLSKQPNIDMGFMKEYHVFDSIFSDECIGFKKQVINEVIKKNDNGNLGSNKVGNPYITKRLSFIDNTENYFDYFDYLYLKNDQVQMVGDITPSYSMLNECAFSYIKSNLEKRGFHVKVVFLMRDPMERVWSMLRMHRRNQERRGETLLTTEADALKSVYSSEQARLRTDYPRTMSELEKVFSKSDIFYGFYESLFTKSSYESLKDFLSIDIGEPDFEFKTNVSPKNLDIDVGLKKEIVNFYSDVYRGIEKISDGYSRSIWGGYSYLP